AVPSDGLCVVGNECSHFVFFYYVDKKGWTFENDSLHTDSLRLMIDQGARYLYSDSRKVDENPDIIPYLQNLVLERGSIKVFSLRTPDVK
nr:hypothetical protein [Bacteroidota bacterium]